jgi:hypothetical protein
MVVVRRKCLFPDSLIRCAERVLPGLHAVRFGGLADNRVSLRLLPAC